jgi:predicted TIM-barrel fold metal-dependent hydrolase
VDVRPHNRWVAEQMAPRPNSRRFRLVTPDSTVDEIAADVDELGFTGLKPYRIYSVTGDRNGCRIQDFLPHEQLELANDRGLWVTMHLSRSDGCADAHNLADLEAYTTKRYPKIKWILAHCARSFTYWPIQQAVTRLRDMPNIWYDSSAVTDVMAHYTLFKQEDHTRIMFGSDNLLANSFRGHYVAMGRFWYQMDSPAVAEQAAIHTDHRPVISIYQQLLCMLHASRLAELEPAQIEDIFYNNAAAALDLEPA